MSLKFQNQTQAIVINRDRETMEFLENAFSALEIDAENDDPTSSSSDGTRKSSGSFTFIPCVRVYY